uniref:Uncharacterized protein n=1 Tax=Chrysotila carterae TaxID=13221 RepID=A0A7S4F5I7_CHRCT
MLLDAKAVVSKQLLSGTNALYLTCRDGKDVCARILLDNSAEVNAARADGETALITAASYGHEKVVRLLLEAHADMDLTTVDGDTAFMCACRNGRVPVVKLLLENDVNLDKIAHSNDDNDVSVDSNSALHCAAAGGHERVVSLLLVHEDDVDKIRSLDGKSPLMVAAGAGHVTVCSVLMQQGASVNYKRPPPHADTALMLAASAGMHDTVEVLLKTLELSEGRNAIEAKGSQTIVDVTETDMLGRTALHLAVEAGRIAVVRLLLRAGSIVNTMTDAGLSPLHIAFERDDMEMVQCLMLSKHINVNALDKHGKTARSLLKRQSTANIKKWKGVVNVVEERMGEVESNGSDDKTY